MLPNNLAGNDLDSDDDEYENEYHHSQEARVVKVQREKPHYVGEIIECFNSCKSNSDRELTIEDVRDNLTTLEHLLDPNVQSTAIIINANYIRLLDLLTSIEVGEVDAKDPQYACEVQVVSKRSNLLNVMFEFETMNMTNYITSKVRSRNMSIGGKVDLLNILKMACYNLATCTRD